jgi:hypothetical protein
MATSTNQATNTLTIHRLTYGRKTKTMVNTNKSCSQSLHGLQLIEEKKKEKKEREKEFQHM